METFGKNILLVRSPTTGIVCLRGERHDTRVFVLYVGATWCLQAGELIADRWKIGEKIGEVTPGVCVWRCQGAHGLINVPTT